MLIVKLSFSCLILTGLITLRLPCLIVFTTSTGLLQNEETPSTSLAALTAIDERTSSDIISTENKIETLVKAKGVNNCIAVINEDATKVNVIVDTKDLTDQIVLQIKEITVSQLGCSYEDVTIIWNQNL